MKKIFPIICFLFLISCKDLNFGAGSFPYAETYTVHSHEEDVIERINMLKKENTDFVVPKFQWKGNEIELIDERDSHWYYYYFYLKDRNQIIMFWTREAVDTTLTTVALVGVRDGLGLGDWKTVNKDLSKEDDAEIKKIFEEQVISKIK